MEAAIDRLKQSDEFFERPQFRWSNADLQTVERETGLRMPTDAADVYKTYGRVGLSETELYFQGRFTDGSAMTGEVQILFLTPDLVLEYHETVMKDDEYPNRLAPNYLLFGAADGGNSYLLVDGKREISPIYFWPLAFDPQGHGDNSRGVATVASSLAEFIASLRTGRRVATIGGSAVTPVSGADIGETLKMDGAMTEAITFLRQFDDYSDNARFKWATVDFSRFAKKTGLTMPKRLEDVYREIGMPGLDETESYFRAEFPDGSSAVGESQIIFNRPEQVIGFHHDFVTGDQRPPRVPENYVIFGTADGGSSFLLTEARREDGAIFFWPLAFDPLGEGDNARGLGKVADSLPEFILRLKSIDEI